MKYLINSKVGLLVVGFAVHISGCASNGYETWKSDVSCAGQHFTITSYCKPSGDPELMNSCKGEQLLSKEGQQDIKIPQPETKAINKDLRATHWKCQQVGDTSYLEIRFAAGLGNVAGDEAVEFFNLQLRPVLDHSQQMNIIRTGKKTNKGRVKSIMPE